MNGDVPEWVRIANPASWGLQNIIGQTTTLPLSLGGTNASTIAGVSTQLRLSTMAFQAASTVAITGGNLSTMGTISTLSLLMGGPARLKGYFVSTLPAGNQGDIAFVTDAVAPTFLVAATGGGAVVSPVFFDGTNWVTF